MSIRGGVQGFRTAMLSMMRLGDCGCLETGWMQASPSAVVSYEYRGQPQRSSGSSTRLIWREAHALPSDRMSSRLPLREHISWPCP